MSDQVKIDAPRKRLLETITEFLVDYTIIEQLMPEDAAEVLIDILEGKFNG